MSYLRPHEGSMSFASAYIYIEIYATCNLKPYTYTPSMNPNMFNNPSGLDTRPAGNSRGAPTFHDLAAKSLELQAAPKL